MCVAREKAELNNKDEAGETALSAAAKNGHLEVLVMLVEAGASPWVQDRKGKTTLHYAAHSGHLSIVKA